MALIGTQINDRGSIYTIRDVEAYETANEALDTAVDAKALAEENAEKIDHYTEQVVFNTHNEFPNIGDSSKLYVATDEDIIYRWDSTSVIYVAISGGSGSDFNVIKNYL